MVNDMEMTIIFITIAIIILLLLLLLGLNWGMTDVKKQQQKILKKKGYQFTKKYYGKGLTPYDVYLDSQKQKLIFFDKGFTIYEYRDLTFLNRQKKVTDGKAKYILDYTLKDQTYHIVLKGRIKTSLKVKYEELYHILRFVDEYNIEQVRLKEEELKAKEKVEKAAATAKKKSTKEPKEKKNSKEKTVKKEVKTTKKTTKATTKTSTKKATTTPRKKASTATKTTKETTKKRTTKTQK